MPRRRAVVFLLLVVIVGLNLRPALSSVAPLLPRLQDVAGISAAAAGILTTLPVLFLGITAPLAPLLAQRIGSERALSAALILLAGGLIMRGLPLPGALYLGSVFAGAAIGLAGTLLPALVKRALPGSADLVTGLYTMALCLGGALGVGLSVPLTRLLGSWQAGLMSWSLLALLALVLWHGNMPSSRNEPAAGHEQPAHVQGSGAIHLLARPLTWYVMLFMGLQSSMAYIVFGWLPTLLVERSYSEATAGWTMATSIMCQVIFALAAPWIARFGRDQRLALIGMQMLSASGLALLLLAPLTLKWPGAVLLGLGQGGGFSLALSLLVLRTTTSKLAGQLSGLVQGGGYTIASVGPFLVGLLLQADAGIPRIAQVLLTIIAICSCAAFFSGRNQRLDEQDGVLLVHRY